MKNSFAEKNGGGALPAREKHQQDLCAFCLAASHCTFVNSSGAPVLECEEFRTYDPIQERDRTEKDAGRTGSGGGPQSVRERPEQPKNRGLCSDCAVYDSCPFPKNRGEVWCCEEYR